MSPWFCGGPDDRTVISTKIDSIFGSIFEFDKVSVSDGLFDSKYCQAFAYLWSRRKKNGKLW